MKLNEIRLGQEYAVAFTMPSTPGIPRTAPVVFAKALDIAGKTVVLDYDRADCGLHGEALAQLRRQQTRIGHGRNGLPQGRKLIRVPASDVLCVAEDWEAPGAPDGRMDGDVPMGKARAAKQTRMALL